MAIQKDQAKGRTSDDDNIYLEEAHDGDDMILEEEDISDDDDDDHDYTSEECDDSDDSSLGSEGDVEAERLWEALQAGQPVGPPGGATAAAAAAPPAAPSSEEILQEHLTGLATAKVTVLKLEDGMVQHLTRISNSEAARTTAICHFHSTLLQAVQSTTNHLLHVIIGTTVLQLFSATQQLDLYRSLATNHSTSITYWKLGTNGVDALCGIPTSDLLRLLTQHSWTSLTEFQIRGLEISEANHMEQMVTFLQSVAPTIKLFNLLGLVLPPSLLQSAPGLLDPFYRAVEPISQLDEVQIHRLVDTSTTATTNNNTTTTQRIIPPMISVATLDHLLQVKPKWWRMTLEGLGLTNAHLEVIGRHLQASNNCKMNDLLSVQHNPSITPPCLTRFYFQVCINKHRMGLVLCDDASLNALVDLVRPLNNLHRRLEYKNDQGQFDDIAKWMDWIMTLSNVPWIDEARRVNYIWFTLLEQPTMIAASILECSVPTTMSTSQQSLDISN